MKLYIDDIRDPVESDFIVLRSTEEAIAFIKENGWPEFISFDHDLGGEDTTMVFLKRLVNEVWNGNDPPPNYKVHSANPVGSKNIQSFMESWKRSVE